MSRRIPQLLIGLFLYGIAIAMMIRAGIGVSPWDVLSQGVSLWAQVLLFSGGLILLAIATGLYIGARFGPGPRDGLMTGISRRFGWPIWAVRTSIEVVVLSVGWVLGGTVGVGTVAFALLIGPMVNVTMPLLRVPDGRGRAARASGSPGTATGPITPILATE